MNGTIKMLTDWKTYYWILRKINFYYTWHISKAHKIKKGKNTNTPCDLLIGNPEKIEIGHDTYIGFKTIFYSNKKKIIIGDYCLFAPNVQIYSATHNFTDKEKPINLQGKNEAETRIGNNVWIGTNTVIQLGTTIGNNTIIGANSLTKRNQKLDSNSIYAGNPAKKIRSR